MVLRANDERVTELRSVGEKLIENARREIQSTRDSEPRQTDVDAGKSLEQELATVRAWACSLDRGRYRAHKAPDGLYIQAVPPQDIVHMLQHRNDDLERAQESTRLIVRYHIEPEKKRLEAFDPDELAADVSTARLLLEDPPSVSAHAPWDAPALVAAAALESHLLNGTDLPEEALSFAADTVLRIGEGDAGSRQYEFEYTFYQQGADRSAARALPLLLLPNAAPLRSGLDNAHGWKTVERAERAAVNLAQAMAAEVRLYLARSLDHIWKAPCTRKGRCHHELALQLATKAMRYCILGAWVPSAGQRRVVAAKEPVAKALANVEDKSIVASRLDAAIRALGPAATANICVSTSARTLLLSLLAAQRRSLLSREHRGGDSRGTQSLVSARALLTLAEHGDDAAIYEHIDAYADHSALLGTLPAGHVGGVGGDVGPGGNRGAGLAGSRSPCTRAE